MFDIDNHGYVTEVNARKLFATNLFAARNIVKPADWESYEAAKAKQAAAANNEYVKAQFAYTGSNDLELSFPAGAVMQVLQKEDADWWWCDLDDKQGYVPANYVEPMKVAPGKGGKTSKFQTIKRGMEVEVLIFSLSKLSKESLGAGKIPREAFVQWAIEHEMDLCFNALEKFDLRANKRATTVFGEPGSSATLPAVPTTSAPALPPTSAASSPNLAQTSSTASGAATAVSTLQLDPNEPEVLDDGVVVPDSVVRSDASESASRISPELATVLRAAGIADKELDDIAMAEFVNYFIDKHAPKVAATGAATTGPTQAGRRRRGRGDDSLHARPLPTPPGQSAAPVAPTAPVAPVAPTIAVTPSENSSSDDLLLNGPKTSLHDQIKAGKMLKPAKKKTNLATLSKKDLTGLGLLLRVQIDSRRNFMLMDDDSESSSGEFGDD